LDFSGRRRSFWSTASFWSSPVVPFVVLFLIPIAPILPATRLRGIGRNDQMDALTSAVTCLGLGGDAKSYHRSRAALSRSQQEDPRGHPAPPAQLLLALVVPALAGGHVDIVGIIARLF
jgi:hypothetical protein